MKTTLAILAAVGMASVASAQTFPGTSGFGPVPDNTGAAGGGIDITIPVGGTALGDSVSAVSITFDPVHTWAGDIVATLIAPNGDDVHVMRRVGTSGAGDSSDLLGTYVFEATGASFATAAAAVGAAVAIPAGTYARFSAGNTVATPAVDADDYSVFTGDNLNGNWTLRIADWAAGDVGGVSAASLTIVPAPGALALLGLGGLAAARRRRA